MARAKFELEPEEELGLELEPEETAVVVDAAEVAVTAAALEVIAVAEAWAGAAGDVPAVDPVPGSVTWSTSCVPSAMGPEG